MKALFTPTIAATSDVAPTISAVNGLDNPISFKAATAIATPPAIFPIDATRLSLPKAKSLNPLLTSRKSERMPPPPISALLNVERLAVIVENAVLTPPAQSPILIP